MKRAVARKLKKALKSGEYVQTTERLRDNKDFGKSKKHMCCIGVICDLFRKETGLGSWRTAMNVIEDGSTVDGDLIDIGDIYFSVGKSGPDRRSDINAPKKVAEWAGLAPREMGKMITLNDQDFSGKYKKVLEYLDEKYD